VITRSRAQRPPHSSLLLCRSLAKLEDHTTGFDKDHATGFDNDGPATVTPGAHGRVRCEGGPCSDGASGLAGATRDLCGQVLSATATFSSNVSRWRLYLRHLPASRKVCQVVRCLCCRGSTLHHNRLIRKTTVTRLTFSFCWGRLFCQQLPQLGLQFLPSVHSSFRRVIMFFFMIGAG
jgi:hypothetical protein